MKIPAFAGMTTGRSSRGRRAALECGRTRPLLKAATCRRISESACVKGFCASDHVMCMFPMSFGGLDAAKWARLFVLSGSTQSSLRLLMRHGNVPGACRIHSSGLQEPMRRSRLRPRCRDPSAQRRFYVILVTDKNMPCGFGEVSRNCADGFGVAFPLRYPRV